jgi:hypothetical protein
MRESLVSDIPAGNGKTANLFYRLLYLFGLDMCYLEWHQICRASESASYVTSCELCAVVYKRYSILRRGHQCRRPDPKGLSLSISETGSVPLGIRTPCAWVLAAFSAILFNIRHLFSLWKEYLA